MEITRREGSQGKWMGTGEWRERWLEPSLGKRLGPSLGRGLQREFGSWLFTLPFLLLLLLPPVFPQCPDSCHCVWESNMVLCTDAGLREFPQGLPLDTVTLHLERNYIRSLPEGAFRQGR